MTSDLSSTLYPSILQLNFNDLKILKIQSMIMLLLEVKKNSDFFKRFEIIMIFKGKKLEKNHIKYKICL